MTESYYETKIRSEKDFERQGRILSAFTLANTENLFELQTEVENLQEIVCKNTVEISELRETIERIKLSL
jgi:hypothetical protein